MKNELKFLLDTNFLMIPVQFKVDVFDELKNFGKGEVYTLDLVIEELKKLKRAKLILELIKKKEVKVLKSNLKSVDTQLFDLAKKGYIVCTQDKKLRKKLRENGFKVVYLRQKKYLIME